MKAWSTKKQIMLIFFTDLINDAIESAIGLNTEIIDKIVIEKINNTVEKPK